jgi:hypothetical protein
MSRERRGFITVSADVTVFAEDVIAEASTEQLRHELAERGIPTPEPQFVERLRGWRDDLELGVAPQSVAADIRRFMFRELSPVPVVKRTTHAAGRMPA